jgi:nitrogen fixation/metabolism regulation signal transduction histidine kinase
MQIVKLVSELSLYHFFVMVHVAVSGLFVCIALANTYRSSIGWFRAYKFEKIDYWLSKTFLWSLYFSLVLGFLLYFVFPPSENFGRQSAKDVSKHIMLRFWAVEHLYAMTFAVILAQIGQIFIQKSISDKNRFAYSAFYNGIATMITLFSMLFYFIYR